MGPRCCNKEAKWVEQTVNLAYWFCEVCKKEVIESKIEDMLDDDSFTVLLPVGHQTWFNSLKPRKGFIKS